jgi:NaMN:DMB phosphoribosyltransferase
MRGGARTAAVVVEAFEVEQEVVQVGASLRLCVSKSLGIDLRLSSTTEGQLINRANMSKTGSAMTILDRVLPAGFAVWVANTNTLGTHALRKLLTV